MTDRPSALARLGRLFAWLRRLLANLLVLALIVFLVVLVVQSWRSRVRVPEGVALVLNPRGVLVEERSGTPGNRLSTWLTGVPAPPRQTLLRDVLDALRLAKDDERIEAVYLDVDRLGGGMSKLSAVREALLDFRESGKPVVAYSEGLSQRPYYLFAHADETFFHPDGIFALMGFGGYRPYYREGLERYGIDVHVFRVGEYKSAVEPYLRNDMSPEAREAALELYGDLWRTWTNDVAAARDLEPEDIQAWIEAWPERLREAQGDVAVAAREAGFLDTLAPRDRARARMIELVGEDEDTHSFEQIAFSTYLRARAEDRHRPGAGPGVAVVTAVGDILSGNQPPGRVGGASTARLIRRARHNDNVKAVVLRVDSPGGSAFASEIIRRECELTREAGKPVVVSMSSVAASGGYWIATSADEIWASPSTITGSIGIFGVYPTFPEALSRYLGVHLDGAGTTSFTDALNPGRPMDPRVAEAVQLIIDDGYREFVTRVSEARAKDWDEVDAIARGRVWTGEDALKLGLVDSLGDLDAAIAAAAKRAELGDDYPVTYIRQEWSLRERLLDEVLDLGIRVFGETAEPPPPSPALRALRTIEQELDRLAHWNDPQGAYAHCLCGEDWP